MDMEGSPSIEMRHVSYTSTSETVSNSSEPSTQKLWFWQLCCCSSHCLLLHVCNKLKHINDKRNVQMKHKLHLFVNTQCCCQNYIILICFHPVFQISSFVCNKITVFVLQWSKFNPVIKTSVCEIPRIKFHKTSDTK